MMSQLTWSALILAVLAALACWNRPDEPACDANRPVSGARPCCERHRLVGRVAEHVEAAEAEFRKSHPNANLVN
jgi:hypothetical protein